MKYDRKILLFSALAVPVVIFAIISLWCCYGRVYVYDNTYTYSNSATNAVNVAPGQTGSATISCPNGQVLTGGGFTEGLTGGTPPSLVITDSYPTPSNSGSTPTGWLVRAYNPTSVSLTLAPVIVCQIPAP